MQYTIDLWFSPIFWIGASAVLFLLIAVTFKWRVGLGSFNHEAGELKWAARIASVPYWLLTLASLFFSFMVAGSIWIAGFRVLLFPLVALFTFSLTAFGVWKRNFWGCLLGLILNFSSILGFLMLNFYLAKFPCEGLGCLGFIIPYLGLFISIGIGILTTPLLFALLKKKTNFKGAVHTMLITFLVSVALVGVWTVGFLRTDLVEEEVAKQRFDQFPEGILYPTYLPNAFRGPISEGKHPSPRYYSYIIRYECDENSSFEIWETPLEGAIRSGHYKFKKIENFSGPGKAYWKEGYSPTNRNLEFKELLIERNGLEIVFYPNQYTCDLSDLTLFKIAESLEEK